MLRVIGRTILFLVVSGLAFAAGPQKTVDFHFIDTEGGQATLIVTPSGESVLVDAGWPTADRRDAKRIVEAAKKAGLKRIDYLLMTHYHLDHVGGVPQLAEAFPVVTMVDHGSNTETNRRAKELEDAYLRVAATGVKRMQVKPGDVLKLKGIRIDIVTARGERISKPLKNGGQKNPLCGQEPKKADDPSENARSIGFLLTFGKFKFVDLGDLTWNKELEIACPEHFIGPVDLFLTTHHGLDNRIRPQSFMAAAASGDHEQRGEEGWLSGGVEDGSGVAGVERPVAVAPFDRGRQRRERGGGPDSQPGRKVPRVRDHRGGVERRDDDGDESPQRPYKNLQALSLNPARRI